MYVVLVLFRYVYTFLKRFIHPREREKENEHTQVGESDKGRERERRSQVSSMRSTELHIELNLMTLKSQPYIMTGAKTKSWTLNRLCHPGTPRCVNTLGCKQLHKC